MNDKQKLEAIKAEIERRIKTMKDNFGTDDVSKIKHAYTLRMIDHQEILSFINSLEEDTSPLTQVNSTPSQTEGERGVCSQQEEFSIVIVLNGQRHRQVLHKGCFSKKECKEKCSLYERCQRCCVDLCMIFFHDPHCHFEEEPVSEGLEEAINAYIGYAPEVDECSSVYGKRQAFKAGVEWK